MTLDTFSDVWNNMVLASALLFAHAASPALPAPSLLTPVAILVKVDGSPKFAGMKTDEARGDLRDTIRQKLLAGVQGFGYDTADLSKPLTDFEDRFDGRKARDKAIWATLAKDTDTGPILFVELVSHTQRNVSYDAMLNNPKKPASETKAKVRFWWYDAQTGLLTGSGDKPLEGVAGAGYFGTSNADEMRGSPDAIGFEIRNTNRKRMDAIAKAVWEAVRLQIPKL